MRAADSRVSSSRGTGFLELGGFSGGKGQLKVVQGSGRKAGHCRRVMLFCKGTGGGKEEPGL